MAQEVSHYEDFDGIRLEIKTFLNKKEGDYDKASENPYEYFKNTREAFETFACANEEHIHVRRPYSKRKMAYIGREDHKPLTDEQKEHIEKVIAPRIAKNTSVSTFWLFMENVQQGFERMSRRHDELAAELRELKDHVACLPPNGGGHSYRFASIKFGLDKIVKKKKRHNTRLFHSRGYQSE